MASPFTTATIDFVPAGQSFARPMTPGQRGYLRDLMLRKAAAKGMDLVQADDMLDTWLAELTFDAASNAIDNAKAWLAAHTPAGPSTLADQLFTSRQVNAAVSDPGIQVVPAGRYAIDTENGAINELAFYKVDRPTEGRWAGRVFVKLIIGGDEQRLSWAATKSVLAKITAAGPEAASARYGHEIGECGICGRQLTNDESRARGIGPVCVQKMGW